MKKASETVSLERGVLERWAWMLDDLAGPYIDARETQAQIRALLAPTPPADAWEDLAKTLWVEGTNDRDATAAKMRAVHESETKALKEELRIARGDAAQENAERLDAVQEAARLRSRLAALDAGEIAEAAVTAFREDIDTPSLTPAFRLSLCRKNAEAATAAVQKILDSKGEEGEAEGNDGAGFAETAPPSPTSASAGFDTEGAGRYTAPSTSPGAGIVEADPAYWAKLYASHQSVGLGIDETRRIINRVERERDEAREQVAELKESMTAAAAQLGWDADDMEERNVPGVPESADIGYQLNVCASRVADESHKLRADLERVTRERDEILREARCWASEAKTQRGTVREVGSALGGMADWRDIAGAVRDKLATIDKLRVAATLERMRDYVIEQMEADGGHASEEAGEFVGVTCALLHDYFAALSGSGEGERRRAEAVERVVEAAKLRVRGKEEGKATLAKEGDDDLVRAVRNLRQIRGES